MALHQGPCRTRQPHAGAAARPSARIEPGREYLAVSARQLVVEPRVRLLPRHRRSLLRRVEPPHRPALAHHVHRPPGLGQCMRISAGWYKASVQAKMRGILRKISEKIITRHNHETRAPDMRLGPWMMPCRLRNRGGAERNERPRLRARPESGAAPRAH